MVHHLSDPPPYVHGYQWVLNPPPWDLCLHPRRLVSPPHLQTRCFGEEVEVVAVVPEMKNSWERF